MRPIDADALMPNAERKGRYDVVNAYQIANAPTIDAVPVVRCKDCRYHEDEQPGMVYCPATVGGWVEDDWFCKGGEGEADVI